MLKLDLKGKEWKSYGNTGTPITMDMGGFYCYYRNNLGGARTAFFKVSDHNEARDEVLNMYGGEIDISPLKVERIDTFGNHTHTYYTECIWDSCLKLRDKV
jgi:hypothetical protein